MTRRVSQTIHFWRIPSRTTPTGAEHRPAMASRDDQPDWQVPERFPYGLSDSELQGALDRMTAVPRVSSFDRVNTSLQAALIQVGVTEQARRRAVASERQSRNIAWLSFGIALIALGVAVAFGVLDYFGDAAWQDDQTKILTEIRDLLAATMRTVQ